MAFSWVFTKCSLVRKHWGSDGFSLDHGMTITAQPCAITCSLTHICSTNVHLTAGIEGLLVSSHSPAHKMWTTAHACPTNRMAVSWVFNWFSLACKHWGPLGIFVQPWSWNDNNCTALRNLRQPFSHVFNKCLIICGNWKSGCVPSQLVSLNVNNCLPLPVQLQTF